MRHLTLKLQTSNGLLVHNGELDSVQGFNFDFLNESSDSTKHLNQIIKDKIEQLKTENGISELKPNSNPKSFISFFDNELNNLLLRKQHGLVTVNDRNIIR